MHGDLGISFFAWDDNTLKLQFEHFVWLISSLCNWDIDAGMHCLQFNYQHCPFAPHVDGTGILQPKLMGGDGFGDQIAVVNVRGDSWLFVASEVPNSFPTKYVGFKARIPEGGLWAIEGSTRYKAMHGVLSDCSWGRSQSVMSLLQNHRFLAKWICKSNVGMFLAGFCMHAFEK